MAYRKIMPPGFLSSLWTAQDGRCFHCGEPMLVGVKGNHNRRWSRDHLVPRALGGTGDGNIVLAHRDCNSARGCEPPRNEDIERARAIYQSLCATPTFEQGDVVIFGNDVVGRMADIWPREQMS